VGARHAASRQWRYRAGGRRAEGAETSKRPAHSAAARAAFLIPSKMLTRQGAASGLRRGWMWGGLACHGQQGSSRASNSSSTTGNGVTSSAGDRKRMHGKEVRDAPACIRESCPAHCREGSTRRLSAQRGRWADSCGCCSGKVVFERQLASERMMRARPACSARSNGRWKGGGISH
jgi:hypothetical protein